MNILDKLVIPNSGANLELLRWLLLLALVIFSIYSTVLFGSSLLSYIFYFNSRKNSNENHKQISKDYIDLITPNRTMAFGLGIVPFLAIILIYTQLLHGTSAEVVKYLIYSFFIFLIAIIFLYLFKFKIQGNNKFISYLFGIIGLLSLLTSLFIFLACVTLAIDALKWNTTGLDFMLSFETIIRLLQSFAVSFALTGITFIVKYYLWDTKTDLSGNEYYIFAKKINLKIALYFTLAQPVFILINLFISPHYILTPIFFGIIALTFFMLPVVLYLIYYQLKEQTLIGTTWAFYLIIIVFALVIFKDQAAFGISSRNQVSQLAEAYNKYESEHPSKFNVVKTVDEGQEIYQSKCTACHKFNEKFVGPPHKDVMLKYADDKAAMVKFILSPIKVNPDYPPMPNQGLKPKEAEAVVDYMYRHFKDKLK